MEEKNLEKEIIITRCDQCPEWNYEHTDVYGISKGHCLYRNSCDASDKPCERGIHL